MDDIKDVVPEVSTPSNHSSYTVVNNFGPGDEVLDPVRQEALSQAIESMGGAVRSELIVKRAELFYKFLKGESDERSDRGE